MLSPLSTWWLSRLYSPSSSAGESRAIRCTSDRLDFWTFFSQATSHAASLTVDAMEITRRIYVPRSVFVAAAVGARS